MTTPHPSIGDWYRLHGGDSFEIVAVDDDDGTIDIQYFDGTLEEMDLEDWEAQWADGSLEAAEAPEDWSGSVDIERGHPAGRGSVVRRGRVRSVPCARARSLGSPGSSRAC